MSKRMRAVWWLGHCLGLAALIALPWLAHRAARPEPLKLRIVQGPEADWSGELKYLGLSEFDSEGRYVFLFGYGAGEEYRGAVWQFDLQNEQITARVEVETEEDESARYFCHVLHTDPNEALVIWHPKPRSDHRSMDWHASFVRRCLFAWGLQGARKSDQIWRWDYHQQGVKPLELVSGRIDSLRQRSPDGKWWITFADSSSKCVLHDARTGLVRWQQPIHPIGSRGGSRSSGQLIWLPDSQ